MFSKSSARSDRSLFHLFLSVLRYASISVLVAMSMSKGGIGGFACQSERVLVAHVKNYGFQATISRTCQKYRPSDADLFYPSLVIVQANHQG